ncbi:MAG: carboxypeptidase regulatory-like domain-containing protein, partial [Planctomycetes bacterium]|nr:carboxypeptidase regulatory-like domain-containing protein [Planctomycetota bacterium]
MGRSLLLLIPLLAAGVAVGFVAGAGSAGAPAQPPTRVPVARPEAECLPPEPPLAGDGPSPPSRQPCSGAPAAPGSIHGSVRTPLGEPVPGVNVSTEVRRGDPPRKTETRTGTDGTYKLSSLPDAAYYLSAKAEGLRVEAVGRGPIRPGGRLDFVASPVESVTVRVVLPDGTEPAEAEVSWTAPASTESTGSWSWTPAEPAVDLPPGPWLLSATAGEDEEYDSEQVTFTPPAPGEPRRAMLALRGRAGILCRLRAEGGAWSGTIQLRAAHVPDDGDRDPERLLRGANSSRSFGAAKSAVAFLGDLRSGMWCVGACSVSGNVLGHSFAEAGPDLRVLEIAVAEPRRSDYLVVRAVDPRGGRATDLVGRLRPAGGPDDAHPGRGRPRGTA